MRQKGSALITALLITAIVVMVATTIAIHLKIVIRENQFAYNATKSYNNLQGVQYWGMAQLAKNAAQEEKQHVIQYYPQKMPDLVFQQMRLSGEIIDAQSLFNINALVDPTAQMHFIRLLKIIVPNITNENAARITKSIAGWLNASNVDSDYLEQNPPYRAAHRNMVNISELRLISGISAKLYAALIPYVTALPPNTNQINVMNASTPVLQSLATNMTSEQAKTLDLCRRQLNKNASIDDFKNHCLTKAGLSLDPNIRLINSSNYFLIKGYAVSAEQSPSLMSLVQIIHAKDTRNGQFSVKLIWQSLNQ